MISSKTGNAHPISRFTRCATARSCTTGIRGPDERERSPSKQRFLQFPEAVMRCPRRPVLLIVLGLAVALPTAPTAGQAPQPAPTTAGKLALTTRSAEAQAEFWKGMEDWQSYSYSSAQRHFRRAYALDNRFALARALATGGMTTPEMAAERERAL